MKISRLDYCQFLLASQTNFTLTYMADHMEEVSHDTINRFLGQDKLTPSLVWENVKGDIVWSENGVLVFDDSILDKNTSHKIELAKKQYSGNTHGLIKGIGFVTLVYINPELERYWVIDFRIYDLATDAKTKLDHAADMLNNAVYQKQLPFRYVLMDTWYATKNLMLQIESLGKVYYCPLKSNRLVDDSQGQRDYQNISSLTWSEEEAEQGKMIKIKGFPKMHKVRLFRVVSTGHTDWVVTNDITQHSTLDAQKVCALRWKVEQFHREFKQLTGVEHCQCRKARKQRNHILCSVLVWVALARRAWSQKQTLYQVKADLLRNYMIQELKSPQVRIGFA